MTFLKAVNGLLNIILAALFLATITGLFVLLAVWTAAAIGATWFWVLTVSFAILIVTVLLGELD